jgi:hypothetical protein
VTAVNPGATSESAEVPEAHPRRWWVLALLSGLAFM